MLEQSWHHSWEKWYYLWGSFKNHEKFSHFSPTFFKDQPSCWSSFPKNRFSTIAFKDQPLCWSYFLKNWFSNHCIQGSTLVLIIFSENWFFNHCIQRSTLVLIIFSKNWFRTMAFKDQPSCWSYFLKIGFEPWHSKINPRVDHIF